MELTEDSKVKQTERELKLHLFKLLFMFLSTRDYGELMTMKHFSTNKVISICALELTHKVRAFWDVSITVACFFQIIVFCTRASHKTFRAVLEMYHLFSVKLDFCLKHDPQVKEKKTLLHIFNITYSKQKFVSSKSSFEFLFSLFDTTRSIPKRKHSYHWSSW